MIDGTKGHSIVIRAWSSSQRPSAPETSSWNEWTSRRMAMDLVVVGWVVLRQSNDTNPLKSSLKKWTKPSTWQWTPWTSSMTFIHMSKSSEVIAMYRRHFGMCISRCTLASCHIGFLSSLIQIISNTVCLLHLDISSSTSVTDKHQSLPNQPRNWVLECSFFLEAY